MAGTYPGFISMKHLGVVLLPPGRDARPLQGYPPAVCRRYPFIDLSLPEHVRKLDRMGRLEFVGPRCQIKIRLVKNTN